MSGWLLFQRLTDWEMPGTHDQNVSVTLPPLAALEDEPPLAGEDEPPLLHAARAKAPATVASASRRLPRWRARLLEPRIEDDMGCYLLILPAAPPSRPVVSVFGSVPKRRFRNVNSGLGS